MAKFRKKPVVVDAVKVDMVLMDAQKNWKRLPPWIVEAYDKGDIVFGSDHVYITTMEGKMRGSKGDWIIRGVKGEIYPCKPDIFEHTYESID